MNIDNAHPTSQRPRRTRRLTVLAILIAAFALLAAACGGDDDSTAAGASGGAPTVAITAPTDGAQVGRSFDVHLAVNFPIGAPDTGREHVHLYYDGNRNEGEYGIAYSDTFTVKGLSPGRHEIQAYVAHPDHSLTDAHSAPVIVDVGSAGTTDTMGSTDNGNGY
ncbi:MAG TPA: hypothetical protein VFX21_12645 [Acidimicrobiia bacterium]|nr:hypothetical protein [Acidimicrobiia bacterium]